MSYDIFVSVSSKNLQEIEYVREMFPDKKIYCPLEKSTCLEYLEALKKSSTLIAIITPEAENVIWDVKTFHYYQSENDQKLENIVMVVENEQDLTSKNRELISNKGYLEDNIEASFDLVSDYLVERDEEILRNMYKQEVPMLNIFFPMYNFFGKAVDFISKIFNQKV